MNKEFAILLAMLLVIGLGTAIVVSRHDNPQKVRQITDLEHAACAELRSKALRFFRQNDLIETENTLRRLLKINPEDRDMMLLYGRVILESGRTENAEDIFRRILLTNPFNPYARNNFGVSLLLRHQYEAAAKELTVAIRQNNQIPLISNNLKMINRAIELSRQNRRFSIRLNSGTVLPNYPGAISISIVEMPEQNHE